MTAHVNIGGTWKQVNGIWTNVSGTWKEITEGHVNAGGTWKKFYEKAVAIPAGLIIPFNGTAAPSGWNLFASANGRFICGSGATSPGQTGASQPNISLSTNTAGSHDGTLFQLRNVTYFAGGSGTKYACNLFAAVSPAGAHSHSYSWSSSNWLPAYRDVVLIKAASAQAKFPQNGVVLGAQSFSGLTNIWTEGRLMRIATSIGTGGGGGGSGTFGTAGEHGHYTNGYYSVPYSFYFCNLYAGAHGHSCSFTPSWSPTRTALSAWTNASAQFDLTDGMIAMWESLTPPAGWVLCNGSNGTPDLRDCFVTIGGTGSHGTRTAGSNTMSISGSVGSVSHNHYAMVYFYNQDQQHAYGRHQDNVSHWHTFSGSGTYYPPYYVLTFIQKAA